MGRSKADLPFGNETMLQRVVRILGQVVSPIVVVAAVDQRVPDLAGETIIVRDRVPQQGPLEGLRCGLSAIADGCQYAYATSCDVPLLVPAFVRRLIQSLEDYDVVVPVEDQFHHPLAAVYRTQLVPVIESLLAAEQRRPVALFDAVRTRRVSIEQFRDVDPDLQTLRNLNTPEQYQQACRAAGVPVADQGDW